MVARGSAAWHDRGENFIAGVPGLLLFSLLVESKVDHCLPQWFGNVVRGYKD